MKFITEQVIRTTFLKSPFDTYYLPLDTKLTPEARQFLIDRKIVITEGKIRESAKLESEVCTRENDRAFLSSLFLLSISLTIDTDSQMAERLSKIYQELQTNEINQEKQDLLENSEDIEITMFHMLLPRGKELAVLNMLQSQLALLINKESNKEIYKKFYQIRLELIKMMKKILGGESS